MSQDVILTKTEKIQWCLLLLASGVFLCLPHGELYTQKMAWFLAITVFNIGLVCFGLVSVYVPAFLMPAGYVMAGVADWQTAMSGWTIPCPASSLRHSSSRQLWNGAA